MTIRFVVGHFLLVILWNQITSLCVTVSMIFNGEYNTMVDMTLNDVYAKVKVIIFFINRFFIYGFLWAANSNFCSRTRRLATILTLQTDRRRDATL